MRGAIILLQNFILNFYPMKKTYRWFRKIAFAEGVSFLILLFIAMPLKYFAAVPMAVTIVGGIHGILFIALAMAAYLVLDKYNRTFSWGIKVFIASIIPFGTFYMDREWEKEEEAVKSVEDRGKKTQLS
jgi:integral membrane protein